MPVLRRKHDVAGLIADEVFIVGRNEQKLTSSETMRPAIVSHIELPTLPFHQMKIIPKSAMPLRQSLMFKPDHHTKSSNVAGWRLWKYLRVKHANASSLSIFADVFTLSAERAYVAFVGIRFPLQSIPDISAIRT